MKEIIRPLEEKSKKEKQLIYSLLGLFIAAGSSLLISYLSSSCYETFGFLPVFLFTYFLIFLLVDLKHLILTVWFLMPFELHLTITSSTHILPIEVINITVFIFLITKLIIERGTYKLTGYEKILIIYLFCSIISLLKSPAKTTAMGQFLSTINGIAFFTIITQYCEKKDLRKFVYIFLFLGIMESILMYLQIKTGEFGYIPKVGKRGVIESLAQGNVSIVKLGNGTFHHFNHIGSFLDVVYPFFLAFLYTARKKILWFAGTSIMIFGVIITHSRGSLIATLVSSIAFLILVSESKFLKIVFPITIGSLSIVLAGMLWALGYAPAIIPSLLARLYMWSVGLNVFKQNFLFGGGIGSSLYYTKIFYGEATQYHSVYISLLSERGIIGFILWLFILFIFFSMNLKSLKLIKRVEESEESRFLLAFTIGSICSFIGFLTHELVEHVFLTAPFKLWFYAFLGFSFLTRKYIYDKYGS